MYDFDRVRNTPANLYFVNIVFKRSQFVPKQPQSQTRRSEYCVRILGKIVVHWRVFAAILRPEISFSLLNRWNWKECRTQLPLVNNDNVQACVFSRRQNGRHISRLRIHSIVQNLPKYRFQSSLELTTVSSIIF